MAWYVKFDGVDGSAEHKDHKSWCKASEFSMTGSKAGGGRTGSSRVGGKMHVDDMRLSIETDKGLPKLLEGAVKGKVFPKIQVHGTATYGDAGEQVYLEVELENVQISHYDFSVKDDNTATDVLTMNLNFEKFKKTFTAFDKAGKSQGKVETSWKVEEGEA